MFGASSIRKFFFNGNLLEDDLVYFIFERKMNRGVRVRVHLFTFYAQSFTVTDPHGQRISFIKLYSSDDNKFLLIHFVFKVKGKNYLVGREEYLVNEI
jgi:hypothetical protein